MKKSNKIISIFLTIAIMLSLVPQVFAANETAASEKGTTELFSGHATYLLQERFHSPLSIDSDAENYNSILSGWDVDRSGGLVYYTSNGLLISDRSGFDKNSMSHELMSHSGDGLVLETAFSYDLLVTDGFYYEVTGGGKTALRLEVKDGYLCVVNGDRTYTQLEKCVVSTEYAIKAEFTGTKNKVDIWVNGIEKGTFNYKEATSVIDNVKLGTTEEQVAQIYPKYVYVYVNYLVNETFMSAPIGTTPEWMRGRRDAAICEAPGSPYPNDLKGYMLEENSYLTVNYNMSGKGWDAVSYSWDMLMPEGGRIEANGQLSIGSKIHYFNENWEMEEYPIRENTWYKIEVVTDLKDIDAEFSDLYVNNIKLGKIDLFGDNDTLEFEAQYDTTVILDNIVVKKAFNKDDFADYPSAPDVVESDDYNIGMVSYPMWREGIHYGWDMISPYEERTPYLGYYTGGSVEVSDWHNKWLLEHGFDHIMYPFVRPDADGPVNFSVRGEELHDGYLNSYYKDELDFAIMITNPTEDKYESGTEFIENVAPFIVEHYLKNPSYLAIDNRLVIYCYNFKGIAECLGDDLVGSTAADMDFTQINMVLEYLDEEAQNIDNGEGGKFDGITLVADFSAGGTKYIDNYISSYDFGENVLKWRYTWGTDKPDNVILGTKENYQTSSNYVTSIPMGFDKTPWATAKVGLMSADEIESICKSVLSNKGNDDPNIVLMTCWDEWGEGHFHAPSNYNGFGYLNAVRKTFTDAGEKADNERPSADALKRIGVLYPEGRQALKTRPDRKVYTPDVVNNLTQKASKNLYNVSGSPGGGTRSSTTINGQTSYVYTITSPDQTTITYDMSDLNMDISDISAIKINGYAENSSTMVAYFQTDLTQGTSNIYPTTLRFEGTTDGKKEITDTILIPDVPDALEGKLKRIRFNPTAKTAVGSEIFINSITFYTGAIETTVYADDKEYVMTSAPKEKNGTVYIPAYRFLLDLNAYTIWDKATKTLRVEKDGATVEFKDGSNVAVVNGQNQGLSKAPYYSEGNLWVAYEDLLKFFGYTVSFDEDANEIRYKSASYDAAKNYVSNGHSWDFDIYGCKEGWSASHALGGGIVKDGMFHLFANTNDPVMTLDNLNISKSDAKYAVLKIKKTDRAENGMLRLYDDNTSATGVVYKYSLSASDDVQEIVIDLTNDVTINNSYKNTYEDLGDTITKIRLDPMDNMGSIYIDSIAILAELPPDPEDAYDYEINAYAFETENLFWLDTEKTGYGYTNMKNSAGTTAGTVLPVTETVDGHENVLKIVPNSGSANCIFTIDRVWYKGSKQYVNDVSSDNRYVKVSFWYKAIGDTTSFKLENRAGGALDGEQITVNDASTDEWKYFEGYYDMSKVGNTSRWFSLRVYQTRAGGLYVRDYSYVCLDETRPLSKFSNGIMAIGVTAKDGVADENDNGTLFVAELKEDGTLHKIRTVDYPMTAKYYMYEPTEGAASVNCMLWDKLTPLTSPKVIKKDN